MTKTGALYANKRVVAKNCTSFLVTPAHLLFTTSQHLLKFVHLNRVEGTHSYLAAIRYFFSLTFCPRHGNPGRYSGNR